MNTETLDVSQWCSTGLLLMLAIVSSPTWSASTDLSDVPMAVKNSAKPNLMFTLDDSGSMQFEGIPNDINPVDFVFPRPATVYGSTWGYGSYYSAVAPFALSNQYARYYRTAKFNKLYYDPAIRYQPWTNADGTLMPNATSTAGYHNPYVPGEGSRDLTTSATQSARWADGSMYPTVPSVTSLTYFPATYFTTTIASLTSPTDANNVASGFTLIEIKPATISYTKAPTRTDCASTTCTYAEEIQNFANWYTYYRSRILAARAGIGKAFSAHSDSLRVGFGAINKASTTVDNVSTSTIISGIRTFSGADRNAFYANLYGHVMPSAGTPLRKAMDDVGQYFSRSDDRGPWSSTPGSTGGTEASCRQNYHILTTDGYWSDGNSYRASTAAARANVDSTTATVTTSPTTYTYTPGNPYSDDWSDTLADVAMYYWAKDLRTDLLNNVVTNNKDPAYWQHMVNFTVGLGVAGTVPEAAITSAFTASPQTITWPDPSLSLAHKSDDLAHAAVNSRGGYFSALNPTSFATALDATLNNIVDRDGSAAAVTVSNPNIVVGGINASYNSNYNSGSWTGDLNAYPVSTTDGTINTNAPIWSSGAQAQLDTLTAGTYSPSTRKIVTYSGVGESTATGAGGLQFHPSNTAASGSITSKLTAAQEAVFNSTTTPPGPADADAVIKYLRGDRSGEASSYRSRSHVLGDIINAEPVIVQAPALDYIDPCYSTALTGTCASSFKAAKASRTSMLFQAANDGMLHAFNASSGAENWAYVPKLIWPALGSRTKRTGFTHQYYIDATPVAGDVDFKNTNGGSSLHTNPAWRTLLVGGFGKGARGYYALNVTDPVATSEIDAATKVLWEFPNSTTSTTDTDNMGYSYARPLLAKTTAEGWVVIVPSGYNNNTGTGTGRGYLYVLNPRNGAVIKVIDTGVGDTTTPAGLAKISAYVENADLDNTVKYVYGGDLLGNVWRFDLTGTRNSWDVEKLAALVDSSGNAQPVTTEPELATVTISNIDYQFVYVGTGRYLGETDVSTTSTQTMYGLIDDLSSSPLITIGSGRTDLQEQTMSTTADATKRNVTNNAAVYSGNNAKKGWFLDFSLSSGERVVTDPQLALGALTFTTNIPSATECIPGGSSWFYAIDYATGGIVTNSTVTYSGMSLGNALASRPTLVKLPSGAVKAIVRLSDTTTVVKDLPIPLSATSGRRVSWREVVTN
jgi:type IV pilus assembly protein PilY1